MASPQKQPSTPNEALSPGFNTSTDSSAELAAVVDDLLNQLNTKFTTISSDLLSKMDDMSRRLDNLEAQIQAGDGKGSGASK
ncbi:heat shock factor binding protein 1-domain-containing protein [Boeremia exigua]|uniref:heat shock factor binding protein 1-domain-containing protein n=1 Tax=Boeremia exigua TaxID=749465 RepID=UPI001E8DD2BC|nr:heat shock factor binding protein 1-domain-containing protein [Boeremia exigua]KAH6642078.1 heat shock factor binding protein 1-domain-containing protein [Boeremia exigua]